MSVVFAAQAAATAVINRRARTRVSRGCARCRFEAGEWIGYVPGYHGCGREVARSRRR